METTIKEYVDRLRLHADNLEKTIKEKQISSDSLIYSSEAINWKSRGWFLSTSIVISGDIRLRVED